MPFSELSCILQIEAEAAARLTLGTGDREANGEGGASPEGAQAGTDGRGRERQQAQPEARAGARALPTRVQLLLQQPLSNATAAVAAAAEAVQAAGPARRRLDAERRAVEAALPGVLSYISSALEAEFLPEASWGLEERSARTSTGAGAGAPASAAASTSGFRLRCSSLSAGAGESGGEAIPEPFIEVLSADSSAGGESLGFLVSFLRENSPRYPHLVADTPAARRRELLDLSAAHDADWALLRAFMDGVGGSEEWEWPELLPARALLARGGLGTHLTHGNGARRSAAMSVAASAAARGVYVLPVLSADPDVGPVAVLEILSAALSEDGGAGRASALLGGDGESLSAASALAETLPGDWGALAAPILCDQSIPAATRVQHALRLAASAPAVAATESAQNAAAGHPAPAPANGGVGLFPSPPADTPEVVPAATGQRNGNPSDTTLVASSSSWRAADAFRRGGFPSDRWSGGRGQRVAVPPAAGWPASAVALSADGSLEAVSLPNLASLTAAGRSLCVEVLTPEGAPFQPVRRWLRVAERRDVLPFGLCYGHRCAAAMGYGDERSSHSVLRPSDA